MAFKDTKCHAVYHETDFKITEVEDMGERIARTVLETKSIR